MNILIVGVGGFLGSSLFKFFNKRGYNVYGIGRKSKFYNIVSDKIIYDDVSFSSLTSFNCDFKFIIYAAGAGSVSSLNEKFIPDLSGNLDTINTLFNFTSNKITTKPVFLLCSSAAVYGNGFNLPISVNEKIFPISNYGINKALIENFAMYRAVHQNIDLRVIRFFSIYGPLLQKQFLWDACNKFFAEDDVIFHGTGDEIRDFLYIDDVCELLCSIIKSPSSFSMFINGGSGIPTKISHIAELISKQFNNKPFSFDCHANRFDPNYLCADISDNPYPLSQNVEITDAVKIYVDWFKKFKASLD